MPLLSFSYPLFFGGKGFDFSTIFMGIIMTVLSGRFWLGSGRHFRCIPTVVAFPTAAPYRHNTNILVGRPFWFPSESTAQRRIFTSGPARSVWNRRQHLQHQIRKGSNERLYGLFASSTTTTDVASWKKDLNDAQVEAVTKPLYSVTRVIAGPGSGKTRCVFVLFSSMDNLILRGVFSWCMIWTLYFLLGTEMLTILVFVNAPYIFSLPETK